MDDERRAEVWQQFREQVNMTPSELEHWLDTEESKAVGSKDGGESVGHRSGRRIVELQRTNKEDLSEADWEHMQKVVGYHARHLAQRPDGEIEDTDWRRSLRNWGHDPVKSKA